MTANMGSGFVEGCTKICPECNGQGIDYCCGDAGVNPPNTDEK
jgi:hypothetical protein